MTAKLKRKPPKAHAEPDGSSAPDLGLLIRHEFEDMISFELDACTPGNVEAVHQMRVTTRRLRAVLRIIAPLMKGNERKAFRRDFRWLAGLLGAIRDHDVFLEWVAEYHEVAPGVHRPALDRLSAEVCVTRAKKQESLVRALAGGRHRDFVTNFREFLTHAELHLPEAAQETVSRAILRIQRDTRRAQKILQSLKKTTPSPHDLHRLRIHFKRLRYMLDFISLILPPDQARHWKKQTRYFARLQSLLGELHDRDVFIARLEAGTESQPTGARYRESGFIARQSAIKRLRAERRELELAARAFLT